MSDFSRRLAVVIGINQYTNGIVPLGNAVNDADQIHNVFQQQHNYETHLLLNTDATKPQITELLTETLPKQVKEDECLLFYFAGHGIALDGDDGPQGYLIPQDAVAGNSSTYLPMNQVHDWLTALPCRHFLTILDCCFAGAFRWSSTRDFATAPEEIYLEHYHRFLEHPAWQVITSASYDETALDALSSLQNDTRSTNGKHSPFAAALIDALKGGADTTPPAQNGKPAGDGVITATELYSYLRDRVETATIEAEKRQTPGLWHLKNHDRGEYIFLTPGHKLNLKNAPPLDESTNPYRGLESFREKDTQLFFGRTTLVEKLYDFVESNCLTVVLGASGSGKSSLVRAGLIPQLRKNQQSWKILKPIRPGASPFPELNNALKQAKLPKVEVVDTTSAQSGNNLNQSIKIWKTQNPGSKLLLSIDQSEELITLCKDESERQAFVSQLLDAMTNHSDELRVVITVRSDFEPQLRDLFLKLRPKLEDTWQIGRFIVPQMTRAELRSVIEKPAEARVMYFEPQELVEQLIDEVADMPGGLPLLSFALSELYLKYLQRQTKAQNQGKILDRSITEADYESIGGVTQSLTQRADEEYKALVNRDSGYAQIIRHVMLRMVALGSGELARRRVTLSELEYSQQKKGLVKEVIERFTKARLLVRGKDGDRNSYVEPAHDALVRGWQKLLVWKQEDEEGLILQRRLTPAAQEWKSQQQVRFLWHNNPRLDLLKKVSQSDDNWLNNVEAEFVERSVRRKNFNTRRNWGVAIAVILGLGTGLVFSLIGQRDIRIDQIQASQEAAEGNLPNLEAWFNGLRAAKSLQDWPWYLSLFKPDPKLKIQVTKTLYKVADGVREWNRLEKHQDRIIGLAISPDDSRIASIDDTGLICLWDKSGKLLNDDCFQGPKGRIYSASFNPDVSLLATINTIEDSGGGFHNRDGIATLALWDLETQQQVELNQEPRGWAGKVVFSQDSKQLATADRFNDSSLVRYWDLSGQEISKNQFKGEPQFSMPDTISSSDGNTATLTKNQRFPQSYKKTIVVNRLYYYAYDIIIETNHTWIERAVFSPDGQQLITAGSDGKISIWDFQATLLTDRSDRSVVDTDTSPLSWSDNGIPLASLNTTLFSGCHSRPIAEATSSLDQKFKATAAHDGTVCLWDSDNNQLAKFTGYPKEQIDLSFSPDGKLLATAGLDGIVKLWDVESKEQVGEFNSGGEDGVPSLNFSSDGKKLALIGNRGILGWWQIESFDELMVRGCKWVREYLESNPNVQESDRSLCDGVPQPKQVASPISTIPSPNPSTLSNHSPSIYTGNDYTITITGIGKNASYKGCDRKNECLEISQASDYQDGRYIWKNDNYQYKMSPVDNGNYQLEVIDPNGKVILNVRVRPNP